MIKEDLRACAADMLFGQSLQLPGDLFLPHAQSSHSENPSASHIIASMRQFAEALQPLPTRVERTRPVHYPPELQSCTHVFIRNDPIHPNLTPAYSGPYEVIPRNTFTFKVMKHNRLISVNVNNVKPGIVISSASDNTSDSTAMSSPLISAQDLHPSTHSSEDIVCTQSHLDISSQPPISLPQEDSAPPVPPQSRRHTQLPARFRDYVMADQSFQLTLFHFTHNDNLFLTVLFLIFGI